MANAGKEVRGYGFTLSWIVLVLVMVYKAVTDPADATSPGYPLGQNYPGDLVRELLVSFVELGFLNAVVRPWAKPSWKRTLVALSVLFPWMIAYAVFSMDGGSVRIAHVCWLLLMHGPLVMRLMAAAYESATQQGRRAAGAEDGSEAWIPWHPQLDPNDRIDQGDFEQK